MKKNILIFSAVLAVTALAGYSFAKLNENIKPVDNPPVINQVEDNHEEAPEQVLPEKDVKETYSVKLPSIEGLELSLDKVEPNVGDSVKLFVKNVNPNGKRVNKVTINNRVVEGKVTSSSNIVEYNFIMPAQDVAVEIVAVEVYGISVAEEVKNALALVGCSSIAAEGDVVEFRPAVYSGFWFYGVKAVEEDVVVSKVAGKEGYYSFTMPNHAVTLTAETGVNVYQITVEGLKDADGKEILSLAGGEVYDGRYYECGKKLRFRFNNDTQQYKFSKAKLNGKELSLDETDGYFHIEMPSYDSVITAEYEAWYRKILPVVDSTESYDMTIKTVVNGEVVDVTDNNLLAEQEVRIYVTAQEGVDVTHKMESFTIKTGDKEDKLSDSSMKPTYNEEGGYYSFNMVSYDFLQITLNEVEAPFKGHAILGMYDSGYKTNNYSNYKADVTAAGKLAFTSYGSAIGANPTFGTYYDLNPVENEQNHYTMVYQSSYSTTNYDVYHRNGFMFVTSYTNSSTDATLTVGKRYSTYGYVFGKNKQGVNVVDGETAETGYTTYAIRVTQPGLGSDEFTKEYFHITFNNGDVVSAYYDYSTLTLYWDVTVETYSQGENMFAAGTKSYIKDAEGNILDLISFKSTDYKYNGYEHLAELVSLDGLEGTYTGASGNMVVTGWGDITIGEIAGTYTVLENGQLEVVTEAGIVYYTIDSTAKTYVRVTDTYEGTYTGVDGKTFTLDGFGGYTCSDGTSGTYAVTDKASNCIEIEGVTYQFDKVNHAFVRLSYLITNNETEYTFVADSTTGVLTSNNVGKNSSYAKLSIVAKEQITVSFTWNVSSESGCDKFNVLLNDTKVVADKSGEESGNYTVTLNPGDKLTLQFYKDSSVAKGEDKAWIENFAIDGTLLYGPNAGNPVA